MLICRSPACDWSRRISAEMNRFFSLECGHAPPLQHAAHYAPSLPSSTSQLVLHYPAQLQPTHPHTHTHTHTHTQRSGSIRSAAGVAIHTHTHTHSSSYLLLKKKRSLLCVCVCVCVLLRYRVSFYRVLATEKESAEWSAVQLLHQSLVFFFVFSY